MKAGVILADPPWRYETAKPDQAIEKHYATLTYREIAALPVGDLCERDGVLFLWATAPKLGEALFVMEAWGFLYRTCMVWHKSGLGMGYYWRIDHEILLLGIKGSPGAPPPAVRRRSVLRSRKRRHSQKPWQVYEMIEQMYPDAVRLELFCREPQAGWHSWGNEMEPNLFQGPLLPLDALALGKPAGTVLP